MSVIYVLVYPTHWVEAASALLIIVYIILLQQLVS